NGLAQGHVTDIRVERVRIYDLARVHQAVRVPQGFELAERADQLGTEHDLQQLAAALAVPVLARQGPAHRHDQLSCRRDVTAIISQPVPARQVEVVARVHAALAEMPVPGTRI